MPVRLGILGLGSVFRHSYGPMVDALVREDQARVTALFDPDSEKQVAAAQRFGIDSSDRDWKSVVGRDDVDAVMILTDMQEHGTLGLAALEAGKHVLIEKPMAPSLDEATRLIEASRINDRLLVCAPFVLQSPTFREMYRRVRAGVIGDVVLARARYGWSGPEWTRWFYQPGGGSLFDLGVYNVVSLCGFLGSVQRVTALVGTAVPERKVNGELIKVEVDDNAHVLLDFGESRFGVVSTGFTIQKYGHNPAIELYGLAGTMHMLGDDWAPEGFEQWRNEAQMWELIPETAPNWQFTTGLRNLVDCIDTKMEPASRPEHAYHVLEVMLAATRSAKEGRVIEIESDFPEPDFSSLPDTSRDRAPLHNPRAVS